MIEHHQWARLVIQIIINNTSCELSSNYDILARWFEINGMLYGGRDYAAVIRLDFLGFLQLLML